MSRYSDRYLDISPSESQLKRKAEREDRQKKKAEKEEKQRLQRKKRQKVLAVVFSAAALVVLVLFATSTAMNLKGLIEERDEARARLDELTNKKNQMTEQLMQAETDEYIEQQARTELRMIYKGEILYVIRNKDDKND